MSALVPTRRGKSYVYKDLQCGFRADTHTLTVDRVQGDPFAAPSRARISVPAALAAFPPELHSTRPRARALCDYLSRAFSRVVTGNRLDQKAGGGSWHGAKGGDVEVDTPGQHILERTSCVLVRGAGGAVEAIEVRFTVGLPAQGRSVMGQWAYDILAVHLPRIARETLWHDQHDAAALRAHCISCEDQHCLRASLAEHKLVAFVRDGAVLPRASGASDAPLPAAEAVPFESPPSLRVTLPLANGGEVTGMGVPPGVTLIVGGGFHGKSTLLDALKVGVFDHVPGDGREFVVTVADAAAIRAEDGRSIAGTDISNFITNLPHGKDTVDFSTADASGSTSQAASTLEAMEAGATCLLIDEDTCATNFMIRDKRMQMLVASHLEPITPFLHKVRDIYETHGVSAVLVIGGCGDYFDVADLVVSMEAYKPTEVTERARAIAAEVPSSLGGVAPLRMAPPRSRAPDPSTMDPAVDGRDKVVARTRDSIDFGATRVDLQSVSQLVEHSQTRAVAEALLHARGHMAGGATVREVLQRVEADMDAGGLDALKPGWFLGNLARPRPLEIAAALNRFRGLRVRQVGPGA